MPSPRSYRHICGMRVDAVDYATAVSQVITWAQRRESRYVCIANVHMAMEVTDDPLFADAVNGADLVTPDGMPLVWGLRLLGVAGATRVYGPDLTPLVFEAAERAGVSVGFYGGSPQVLDKLVALARERFPKLSIPYRWSPPFRPLSEDEQEVQLKAIRDSGVQVLLVGLGCPKQERWMARHRRDLPAVLLGVGAAFDFLTGAKPQAPRWMMASGLEWLFRLVTEPRRLWLRYLKQNPRFLLHFTRQWLSRGSR